MKGYMYILECADNTFYTGSTNNIEKRIYEHQSGAGSKYTKSRLPVKLVYVEEFDRIDQAFAREKQVQNWSHAKKKALLSGDFDTLQTLANCRNDTHHSKNNTSTSLGDHTSTSRLSSGVSIGLSSGVETTISPEYFERAHR